MNGADLRAQRIAKGWSQRRLARESGLSHRAEQYWEAKPVLSHNAEGVKRMVRALGWKSWGG